MGIDWGRMKTIDIEDWDRTSKTIPVTWIPANQEGADLFNEVYNFVKNNRFNEYIPTRRGYIPKGHQKLLWPAYDVVLTKGSIQMTVIAEKCAVLRFRTGIDPEKGNIRGGRGYRIFKRVVERYGGDLSTIAIDNGAFVKTTIAPPLIEVYPQYIDKIIENAWHLDINSAYMHGIKQYALKSAKEYPETDPKAITYTAIAKAIDEIYERRKENAGESIHYKFVLNVTQGYMQSQYCILNGRGYALAHLSKAGIESCRNKIESLARALKKTSGAEIIGFNTDGIWFTGVDYDQYDYMYHHPPGDLGNVQIDHKASRLRFRMKGAYEFEENGIYNPVIRGRTRLDKIIPRTEWKWGDIYHHDADIENFQWIQNVGIMPVYEGGNYGYDT